MRCWNGDVTLICGCVHSRHDFSPFDPTGKLENAKQTSVGSLELSITFRDGLHVSPHSREYKVSLAEARLLLGNTSQSTEMLDILDSNLMVARNETPVLAAKDLIIFLVRN